MKEDATATKTQTEVKNVPSANGTKKPENDPKKLENAISAMLAPTAEQRLINLKNFQHLGDRFVFIQKKQDELNAYSISNDETKEKMKLTNSAGVVFEISNSDIIEKVIGMISNHLSSKLEKTRQEILEFTI